MKAINLTIRIDMEEDIFEPDAMNSTDLSINGERVWPVWENDTFIPFHTDTIEEGDILELNIPSGTLSGVVFKKRKYEHEILVYIENATWEGLAGGLAGGLSGLGGFYIENSDAVVVESSALPQGAVVDLATYERVRELCDMRRSGHKAACMMQVFKALDPSLK